MSNTNFPIPVDFEDVIEIGGRFYDADCYYMAMANARAALVMNRNDYDKSIEKGRVLY